MNGIIQEILTLLDSEATRSSVAVRTELAADLPEIAADRVQLQQVFMNLMLTTLSRHALIVLVVICRTGDCVLAE